MFQRPRKIRNRRLGLELLERRELMSGCSPVLFHTPAAGSTVAPGAVAGLPGGAPLDNVTKSTGAAILGQNAAKGDLTASSPSYFDQCNQFNGALWRKAQWALGKGIVSPANVSASGGHYKLTLKAHSWDGAEIYTPTAYR